MITFDLVLFILIIHFLADFGLQTHEQAINKYKGGLELIYHVTVYSTIWFFASYFILNSWIYSFCFATITMLSHALTDFITSNISKEFFDKKDFHNGFVVVGFDQMLHYIQLLLTFMILT